MSCLSYTDYQDAAEVTGLTVAHIQAVSHVESRGVAFDRWGHPTVLFERHVFHRLTGGRHSARHSDLSNQQPGGYGRQSDQPHRLQRARELDDSAAVKSASWGLFQIMGFNHEQCGFLSLDDFELAMRRSARDQLLAFAAFIKKQNLAKHLLAEDWGGFARRYNGPAFAKNKYDEKIEAAYRDAVVRRMVSEPAEAE